MENPLLRLPGAVLAEGPDAGVAAHYGDPSGEQRALDRAAGLVDRSHRGVVRIGGPDRLSWLNSLSTQLLDPPPASPSPSTGDATQTLILSPNGHIEHHLTLVDDGTQVWAHVEPGTAAGLIEFLESMRFMLRVEPADVTGEYAVLTLMGPDAPDADETQAAALPGRLGTDLIIPRDRLPGVVDSLTGRGVRPAGMWAYEALRIAAHQPRLGLDTDHRTIPHEVGWIGTAVHLDKGCYRGQETVARVHNLGHPPRRLVLLHLDGSVDRLPSHGDAIEMNGDRVGVTGSAARHYELGPIALGLVKRTTPTGAQLLAGGVDAAQEVIVPPDAGANVKVTLRRTGAGMLRPPG
jgi:folate-binding protein YgfZ